MIACGARRAVRAHTFWLCKGRDKGNMVVLCETYLPLAGGCVIPVNNGRTIMMIRPTNNERNAPRLLAVTTKRIPTQPERMLKASSVSAHRRERLQLGPGMEAPCQENAQVILCLRNRDKTNIHKPAYLIEMDDMRCVSSMKGVNHVKSLRVALAVIVLDVGPSLRAGGWQVGWRLLHCSRPYWWIDGAHQRRHFVVSCGRCRHSITQDKRSQSRTDRAKRRLWSASAGPIAGIANTCTLV